MNKLIEAYSPDKAGYNPFLIRPGWQVAVLNTHPDETLEAITRLDIHYKTDEAFVLLKGQAVLISATIVDGEVSYEVVNMQPQVCYNIPVNVWHNIALYDDTQVLIIEADNTHLGDFEFYDLSAEQIDALRHEVHTELAKTSNHE